MNVQRHLLPATRGKEVEMEKIYNTESRGQIIFIFLNCNNEK